MSPTSYQTAPPRELMIATVLLSVKQQSPQNTLQARLIFANLSEVMDPRHCSRELRNLVRLPLQLLPFASFNRFFGINGFIIHLLVHDFS